MKIKSSSYFALIFLTIATNVSASQSQDNSLNNEREKVVQQYITDLKNADYTDITQLFEPNGIVVSTSRGKVNANDFFNAFLPAIDTASTELHQLFLNATDHNRYAARFHFNFKLKDGETGDGEYVDEFIFADQSTKLSAVYMFENLKFPNVNIE